MPRAKKTTKAKPKSAKKASGRAKKRSVKVAKKTGRKPAKRAAKKAVKKTGRKTAKKVAKKTGRKPAKKAAKKAPGKAPRAKKPAVPKIRHSQSRIRELTMMLEAKRAEIMAEIKRARQDSINSQGTSFPEVGDLVSASVEKERAFEYGEAVVNALREIDTALEKLKSGTYGVCEVCNKAIGVKRLQVVPSARLCIKCKSRQEAFGGMDPGRSDTFND